MFISYHFTFGEEQLPFLTQQPTPLQTW